MTSASKNKDLRQRLVEALTATTKKAIKAKDVPATMPKDARALGEAPPHLQHLFALLWEAADRMTQMVTAAQETGIDKAGKEAKIAFVRKVEEMQDQVQALRALFYQLVSEYYAPDTQKGGILFGYGATLQGGVLHMYAHTAKSAEEAAMREALFGRGGIGVTILKM